MELRHLRYFCAVAESLNFTRAAERLHVTQPALSRQIKALEDELGTILLDRNRQRVLLTDAGRLFFGHVQKILAQVDIATLTVRAVPSGTEGELRIGLDWRLPASLISRSVSEYRKQFPRVEVTLRDMQMSEQIAALHTRNIHLGFVASALLSPDETLASRPVVHSEIVVVTPATHPLAGRSAVKLAELRKSEWICVGTPDNGYRNFLQQTCRNAGFTPRFSRSVANQSPGLIGLVGAGMGVALMPELALPADLQGVAIIPSDCDPLDICALWDANDQSPLLRNFMAVLAGFAT